MNLNTRILNALATRSQAVIELSAAYGTPNTIRKSLSRLKKEGKVTVVATADFGLGRQEKIWGVVSNIQTVA